MTALLPWVLILVIDGGLEAPTAQRFETEEACVARGEDLVLHIITDLQLTTHTVDFRCVKTESARTGL